MDKMSTSTLPEQSRQLVRSPGIHRMHLFWVWLLLISPGRSEDLTGPQEVTGHQGGSLTVQCQYEEQYLENIKYWCDGRTRFCTVVVSTQRGHRHVRFSIRDDRATRTFTVTMQRLRVEDAGNYQCGISTPGLDPMFLVRVTVLQASTTMKPTSTSTTTGVYHSSSKGHKDEPTQGASSEEETILLYLLPTVGVLLLVLLVTGILLFRAKRRKKQAIRETVTNNSQLSDMFPDTIPAYAAVMKSGGSQKFGVENIAVDEDVIESEYEEIQVLPRVPDPVPVYAVVRKPGASQKHGVQNNFKNEDCYEDRQEMPKIPHTIPIYAVVKKKPRTTTTLELENDAMDPVRQEQDYEEIQTSPSIGPVKSFHRQSSYINFN
ncbi:uncharacterized protein LOC144819256 [Lissotriton helveticus]